jgi:Fe-S cluster biogenesis protein NfuA
MTMKLVTNQRLLEKGALDFPSMELAAASPLAEKLFQIPGVAGVFIGSNFVTITKNEFGGWNNIMDLAADGLRTHLAEGLPIVGKAMEAQSAQLDEVSVGIQRVIDAEIRPAVAMDGGDIVFVAFREGIVYLKMKGSCSGCPSSTATLKMGIERRLQEEFPQVQGVQPV